MALVTFTLDDIVGGLEALVDECANQIHKGCPDSILPDHAGTVKILRAGHQILCDLLKEGVCCREHEEQVKRVRDQLVYCENYFAETPRLEVHDGQHQWN